VGSSAGPIAVADGRHVFDLVNETLGFRTRTSVEVRAGQMVSVPVTLPSGRININAAPWAEVAIDGTPAGQTPLANLEIPIGTHEIVFRHPQFGEQRHTVVVKADDVTRVSASFRP
jgi:serine/threonine-protein kinase